MTMNLSTNVIAFGDKRLRSIQENYERLIQRAREQFPLVQKSNPYLIADYEDTSWRYRGETVWFNTLPKGRRANQYRIDWPAEISELVKAFIIDKLFRSRTRKEPLSATRLLALRNFAPTMIESGVTGLDQINAESYDMAFNAALETSKDPTSLIQDLNLFIEFLCDAHVLRSVIDLRSPIKDQRVKEKVGPKAKTSKMPLPELIRAIIALRWKVEESFDGSDRMISDMLCVYTQVFAYALGLRAGEILRIPEECLFWDGPDLRCRVYTEKGQQARAPYVPTIWRELVIEIVDRIKNLTKAYRERARELEKHHRLSEVEERINKWRQARESDAQALLQELDDFLLEKRTEATNAWALRRAINPETEYSLDEVQGILPISSDAKATPSKVQNYRNWELNLTVVPIDPKRNSYTISGQSICIFINEQIERRASHIIENEFLSILHARDVHREISGDKTISSLTKTADGSSATCYTFNPTKFAGKGRAPAVMSRDDAAAKLRDYALGGFDPYTNIDLYSFNELFPEIPLLFSSTKSGSLKSFQDRNPLFKINNKQKIYAKVKTEDSHIRYSVNEGFTIDIESIHSMLIETFTSTNLALEKEIWEQDKKDQEEEAKFTGTAVTISSKAFSVEQNVSDFLFLRCRIVSGNANSLVPEILSYQALRYAMQGNDRMESMFERYDVNVSEKIRKSWSSHQGRHWKTTSMLRAGLEAEVVNRYMGREASQLDHYDHNTGIERAKILGEAMQENQTRFLGAIPQTVRRMQHENIPVKEIDEYLDETLQTAQFTPCGMCVGSLNLNPCEFNMGCLVGNDGNGCSRYIFDTQDAIMRATLANERDKSEREISRLLDVLDAGNSAAEKHILRHATLVENISKVFDLSDRLLANNSQKSTEIAPFEEDGSLPEDCPFGCGDD
ncbi:hypothetical protein GCM10011352_11740 [Marinobacterium zhoushanense]|uniref:Phage integrase family protein n=1 Tax=Marinobacterium zhoushanense TaxID=1679163 RepID=A0ABQ1K822_9GAMM|nr:hypothetical protein [Marinobacterium zhoushanense]GGB87443.1 hypothetical protein GCM10011352_11740 [Marinobacterium zhoushanense]